MGLSTLIRRLLLPLLICVFSSAGPAARAQDVTSVDSASAADGLQYSYLAQNSYSADWIPADTPGWTRVAVWTDLYKNPAAAASGFNADVYKDLKGNIAIAYRGTISDWQLWTVDRPAFMGQQTPQFNAARDLAIAVKAQYPNARITVTGHSLGGALATYAGQQVPGISRIVTFNGARLGILNSANPAGVQQTNYIVPGDGVGDPRGKDWGIGSLPGKNIAVRSTTTDGPTTLDRLSGSWQPQYNQNTHGLAGVIGGMCIAAGTACPAGVTSASKPPTAAWTQSPPTASRTTPAPDSGRVATVAPGSTANPASRTAPFPSSPIVVNTQPARFAPGGISLSKAAAERMPLNLSLDSAYLAGDRLVLSGQSSSAETIDAALFLTALRATCQGADPYFSLDPDNMAAWMSETHQAGEEFHARTKADYGWSLRKGARASTPSILNFRTVSASHDYPDFWRSVLARYPNMRSRLVFKPEWLRQTRFGEVLYKADVLLKELAGGAPALDVQKLRAAKVDTYRSATAFRAASNLLDKYYERSDTKEAKGGRIWYDFADTPRPPGEYLLLTAVVAQQPYPRSELLTLISERGLLKDAAAVKPPSYGESDGIVDLSQVFPRMYVRVRDPVTLRDGSGNYPGLDELVSEANANPAKYAAAYREYQLLVEVFRAYAIAVRIKATRAAICRVVPRDLLPAEKIDRPLPDYHPTELTETIAWYEYSDRRMRRAVGTSGGLFQGGVSVGATSFMANAAHRVVDTPLIREIKTEASVAPQESAWSNKAGRQFVAFRIDEYPEGVKVTSTKSGSFSPAVPAQSLEVSAPQPNQKVAANVLPGTIRKLPETVKPPPPWPTQQNFSIFPSVTSQSSQWAPIGAFLFVIVLGIFVVRLTAGKPGSQNATATAASAGPATNSGTTASPKKDPSATYNAVERDFKNVFAMKSMADRETMIRSWRAIHGGSRENAMKRLVEHCRQDNRSWR